MNLTEIDFGAARPIEGYGADFYRLDGVAHPAPVVIAPGQAARWRGYDDPAPLLALQILYLNLVTDVFPAFALGLGQGDGHEMRRPPRDPQEPITGRAEWMWIAGLAMAQTVATLAAFMLALFWLELGADQAVTVAFLTLALAQLWNVFNTRAADTHPLVNDITRNRYVWGALALCLVLIGSALWLPGLAEVLSLAAPGKAGLLLAAGVSVAPLLLGQIGLAVTAAMRSRRVRG